MTKSIFNLVLEESADETALLLLFTRVGLRGKLKIGMKTEKSDFGLNVIY